MSSDLVGVVLMGGQSTRMGTDKSQLTLNDQSLAQLADSKLQSHVDEVYYSINKQQQHLELQNSILDQHEMEGPLSGIISALNAVKRSIVVLGVDLPLVTELSIAHLIKQRNWDLLTTTYYNEQEKIWEPMLSIWEYEALPCLEEYFEKGGRSIQKFLNSYGNQRVAVRNSKEFTNINTVAEYNALKINDY